MVELADTKDLYTAKLYNKNKKFSKYNLEFFSEHKLQKRFLIYKNKDHYISNEFLKIRMINGLSRITVQNNFEL